LLHCVSLLLAHHDRPSFSGRPSLTGHCGHGWTYSVPRPVAIDPEQTPLLCGRASSESFQPVKLHCAILVVEHVGGQDALRILVRCGSAIMNWAA
jgi:hypothetical protein